MSRVVTLLRRVPIAYEELGQSLLPSAGRGEMVSGGGELVNRRAPASIAIIDHRHKLLRGLRWWVDALDGGDRSLPAADNVAAMCGWLTKMVHVLEPEDEIELTRNLGQWVDRAFSLMGDRDAPKMLPPDAWDQEVPVAVAAKVLGVNVSTVRRRAPSSPRVRLGDVARPVVPRCTHSDLPTGMCDHCRSTRPVTPPVA